MPGTHSENGPVWLTANPTYDAGKELRNIGFDDTSHRNAQRLAILDAKFISMGNQIQRLPERKILQT